MTIVRTCLSYSSVILSVFYAYWQLFQQFVYLIAATKANECLTIETGNTSNAWSQLQQKCYDHENGIFRFYTYKDSKKLKEWTLRVWRCVAEMALQYQDDELKHVNNSVLFHANEHASIFFKLQEQDKEKKKQAQECSEQLQKKMGIVENQLGFRPPGATELHESKKISHSTGLLRSGPQDAGSILLESSRDDQNMDGKSKRPRIHKRPGDFDGLKDSFTKMDGAVKALSNLVTETIMHGPKKLSFSEAVAERMRIKRDLKELGDDDDENDKELKEILQKRRKILDKLISETVEDGNGKDSKK